MLHRRPLEHLQLSASATVPAFHPAGIPYAGRVWRTRGRRGAGIPLRLAAQLGQQALIALQGGQQKISRLFRRAWDPELDIDGYIDAVIALIGRCTRPADHGERHRR